MAGTAILIYHVVADVSRDPFGIAVPPATFDAHMEIISKRYRPLTLSEAADAAASGSPAPRSVAVTFDDGYANNLTEALPILAKWSVPATIFVATGSVESGAEFWWDQLERLIFDAVPDPTRPALELSLNGDSLTCAASEPISIVQEAWQWLERRGHDEIGAALEQVQRWSGRDERLVPRESHRPMTVEELRAISAHPLIEVGAHTRWHPKLSARELVAQREEIERSRVDLVRWLGGPPESFAYPFGRPAVDYSEKTVAIVRELGFRRAVSARPGLADRSGAPYELPRFFATNREPDDFERWLDDRLRWSMRRAARALASRVRIARG